MNIKLFIFTLYSPEYAPEKNSFSLLKEKWKKYKANDQLNCSNIIVTINLTGDSKSSTIFISS